ncbi:hypothetical protein IV500_07100 [Paeniglutamicibacter antarcticus]|uniref:Uncharacterized protein n=1 Tax=Arthrobacter terrae TaxID=2935737 RepID=A0A931CNH0_9MICC|nr:hypothetical protein [Arthrobacter terrae]MBG0739161.1 hypothetical protein [Arthrobacter terrae]
MSSDGRLTFKIESSNGFKSPYFDLPPNVFPKNDAVAAAAALLIGRGASIEFDFPVSSDVLERVDMHCNREGLTGSKVQLLPSQSKSPTVLTNKFSLAFSGGFDSLTARDILPPDTPLVSLDFGGRFARERPMFEIFGSNVICTNLVEIGLNRASWSFMAIGNLLLRDSLKADNISFGTVTEARPKYFRFAEQVQPGPSTMSELTGMPVFNPVLGLTEVATAQYALERFPHLIPKIFRSVANPGEEKSYRKSLLLRAAAYRTESALQLDAASPPEIPIVWGTNTSLDFLAVYLIKFVGLEAVQMSYRDPIPEAILRLSEKLRLTFYAKANSNFYGNLPRGLQGRLYERLSAMGIGPYESRDFSEFAQIIAALGALSNPQR